MKFIPFVSLVVIAVACNTTVSADKKENKDEEMLRNYLGTWVADYDSLQYRESWTAMSDSLFISTGSMLAGADSIFSETVEIRIGKDGVYYEPTVKDQNEGQSVSFKIKELTETGFVAENLQHDFPQRIVYSLQKDSLIAYIEGDTPKEKNHREYFRMKKAK